MNIVNAGSRYQVYGEDVKTYKVLPAATYGIGYHPQMGFWLTKQSNLITNEDIIYGDQNKRADKILRSFNLADRNFGVILSGKKGIGKSLLARLVAEKAIVKGLPVIIVDCAIPGLSNFLSSIEQEAVIIFDEFEKVFAKDDDGDPQVELLSLFDGMNNGKKLFIITCNDVTQLNEFLINRPGRFHYHFEITCPSADEIRAYMRDKLGDDSKQEEIEKLVKLSQMADITYDCLRAVAFDLAQGYSLEETLADLNINYEKYSYFDVTVRLSNDWVATDYGHKSSLYDKDRYCCDFNTRYGQFYMYYYPRDIIMQAGVLTIPKDKVVFSSSWEMFDDAMSDDEATKARKEFDTKVQATSIIFSRVAAVGVNKYLDI
jgi:SpoVK/Ycf46/Vps4 family AAA+-type ATPase